MEIGSSSSTCGGGGGGGGGGGSKSQGLKFEIDPPSAGKKVRSGVVGQGPRCQVEGCKVDLSDAKAYYSRHKVCSIHSKSPQVIVAGLHQRFCQQCSRFHQLPEFDQGKRSCRRRLAGHNERRRKPPPGSLLSNRYGNLSSSAFENNGRFSMDFATNPILQGRDSWPSTLSSGRQMGNQVTVAGKFELSWQCNQQNPPPDLLQGLMTGTSCVGPGISDSCSAPSLLSNQPWGSRNHSSSRAETNSLVQACVPTGHFSISSQANQVSSRLQEMPPDLGLGQISQPGNRQYSSELEMAPQGMGQYREIQQSTGFSSSVQHTNWSL